MTAISLDRRPPCSLLGCNAPSTFFTFLDSPLLLIRPASYVAVLRMYGVQYKYP